jgi:UDP-N-acetylmuramate dehydrogenase
MAILEYVSLQPHNTFGVDACARYFCRLSTKDHLVNIIVEELRYHNKYLIIGGGSNILFCSDYDGLVIHNEIKGIDVVKEDEEFVWVKALSGTTWHNLVLYCVEKNWGGIENLSLIPGTAGAAPIQNIGAYGAELKDRFESLEAIDMNTGEERIFQNTDCRFGYRQSIFKNELKGKYFIYSITLKLSKHPIINTQYGDIRNILMEKEITNPTIRDVSDAVICIRSSKLPNPAEIGNAGSFFKNPEVTEDRAKSLYTVYPDMPVFAQPNGMVKIPAAWLIEQCGWKGKQIGHTGNHARQALVIVNYGNASGVEIWQHAQNVQRSVKEKFGIILEPEVNVV